MDGILAVDFVLANYAGGIWKSLRLDSQYANLITPQFEQFWQPYFTAVTSSWNNPPEFHAPFLCPFVGT